MLSSVLGLGHTELWLLGDPQGSSAPRPPREHWSHTGWASSTQSGLTSLGPKS